MKLVPRYDAMLAARYGFGGGFFSRIEIGFTGETQLDERNRATQPAVETYNVQLGYEGQAKGQAFTVRLFGVSLTEERRFSGLGFDNFGFGADGNFYAPWMDAPRVVGIELESKF